jgi:formylglycine-generating enzyme required for sulfatase activity
MADRSRVGRRASVLAGTFAIGACGLAISAWALEPAQKGSAVSYSTNDLGMEFVSVPAGQFSMGCSEGAKPVECSADEKPRHTVQITKAFEIGKTEVTQKQWQTVMGSDPSRYKGDTLPVELVSFQDVQVFLSRLSARNDGFVYRLPTEAEWEYGARAGTADQFAGATVANSLGRRSPPDDWAWYNVEKTQPVAEDGCRGPGRVTAGFDQNEVPNNLLANEPSLSTQGAGGNCGS